MAGRELPPTPVGRASPAPSVLERLGVVKTTLKRAGGGRRIHFSLNEEPLQGIEELFLTKA